MSEEHAKVVGELDDDGAGVVGRNVAGSGETYGVLGEVDSTDGYGLATEDDAVVGGVLEVTALAGALTGDVELTELTGGGLVVDDHSLTVDEAALDVDESRWEPVTSTFLTPAHDYDGIYLDAIWTNVLSGPITGDENVTDLTGDGLEVDAQSLTVDVDALDIDASNWTEAEEGQLEPLEAFEEVLVDELQAGVVDASTYRKDGEPYEPSHTIVQTETPTVGPAGTDWKRVDDPGTKIWEHDHHGTSSARVMVVTERDGVVYSGSADETVAAADATDGTLLWQENHHTDRVRTITERNGVVYSAGNDRSVVAMDAEDGSFLWDHDEHEDFPRGIAARDDVVLSAGWDNTVIAVDADDGSFLWDAQPVGRSIYSLHEWRGRVFTGHSHGPIYVTDAVDGGATLWDYEPHTGHVESIFVRNGVAYSGSRDETVHAADATREGSPLWTHDYHNNTVNSVMERDGVVYSGSNDGTVVAADAADGRLLWSHDVHDGDTVYSVFERDGVIYSGSVDGMVVASVSDPATYVSNGTEWLFESRLASDRDGGQSG